MMLANIMDVNLMNIRGKRRRNFFPRISALSYILLVVSSTSATSARNSKSESIRKERLCKFLFVWIFFIKKESFYNLLISFVQFLSSFPCYVFSIVPYPCYICLSLYISFLPSSFHSVLPQTVLASFPFFHFFFHFFLSFSL